MLCCAVQYSVVQCIAILCYEFGYGADWLGAVYIWKTWTVQRWQEVEVWWGITCASTSAMAARACAARAGAMRISSSRMSPCNIPAFRLCISHDDDFFLAMTDVSGRTEM